MENNKEQKVLELKQKLSELRSRYEKQSRTDFCKALSISIGGSLLLGCIAARIGMLVNTSLLETLIAIVSSFGIMANIGASIHFCTKKSGNLLNQIRTTSEELKQIKLEVEHEKELELVKQIEAFDLENQDKITRSDYIKYLESIKKLVEMNPEKGIEILKRLTQEQQSIINVDEQNKSVEKAVSESSNENPNLVSSYVAENGVLQNTTIKLVKKPRKDTK